MRSTQKKTPGKRDYRSYLILGGKGQGKSTFLRDQIDIYLRKFSKIYGESVAPRVFVHDLSGSRAFSDIMTVQQAVARLKIKVDHPLDLLKAVDSAGNPVWKSGALRYECRRLREIELMYSYISDNFRNGLLILDEWTTYVRANPPDWQIDIVNNHRNWGVEAFFVCHQIMKVPPFFVRGNMIAKIIIFKTGENNLRYKQVEAKYSCAEQLWTSYNRVKEAPETDNLVQYFEMIEI